MMMVSFTGSFKDPVQTVSLITGVTIDLEDPSYSVNEENGTIEVCAVITSGSLEKSVVVTLATAEGTATGERCNKY